MRPGAVRPLLDFRRVLLGVMTGAVVSHAAAWDAPVLKPDSGPWQVGKDFNLDKKTRRSVSGIACVPGTGERVCVLAFDEGVEARHAVLRGRSLSAESQPIALLSAGRELDAEGVATDGNYVYVTGSHSMSRTRCAANPDSRHVIRFRIDQAGRALRDQNAGLVGYQDSGRLWTIMSNEEGLKEYVGKCLGTQPPDRKTRLEGGRGVNVEGLAVKDGHLYFGFRGPARDGTVPILSVDADSLFGGQPLKPVMFRFAVGEGRGIRDMLAVKDGFLVLVGPDDDERKGQPGYMLLFWDGKASTAMMPRQLAHLDVSNVKRPKCDRETKPEAIALISDSPVEYQVLVLSDGMCDGGPLTFTVRR